MSEYQYYEFLSIDRPLTKDEMAGHLRRKALIQRLVKAGIWRGE
jgi:hypothetical protein